MDVAVFGVMNFLHSMWREFYHWFSCRGWLMWHLYLLSWNNLSIELFLIVSEDRDGRSRLRIVFSSPPPNKINNKITKCFHQKRFWILRFIRFHLNYWCQHLQRFIHIDFCNYKWWFWTIRFKWINLNQPLRPSLGILFPKAMISLKFYSIGVYIWKFKMEFHIISLQNYAKIPS